MYSYKVSLRLAFPTTEAPKNFKAREADVAAAVSAFNKKYQGKKSISVIELSNVIVLELQTKQLVKNPTREFNVFSQTLKSDYGWSEFTQVDFRMFDATLLEEPDVISKDDGKITVEKIFNMKDEKEIKQTIYDLETLIRVANMQLREVQSK